MTRWLACLTIVAIIPIIVSPDLFAQSAGKPALSVVPFDGAVTVKDASDEGTKLADEVATQLADSGCCRVLPAAWMPRPLNRQVVSVEAMREGAAAAGVQDLVFGSVSESTRTTAGPRSIVYGQGPIRLFGLTGPVGRMRPMSPMGPAMAPLVSRVVTTNVTVRLRVIDVASGEVVRTLQAQRGATSQASGPVGPAFGLPRGAAGLALAGAAAIASRPKRASDSLVDRVVQEVALALIRVAPELVREEQP